MMAGKKAGIKKGKKQGQYLVESSHSPGKFYTVDINRGSCSCPQWLFRMHHKGEKCKHILAVEQKYHVKVKEGMKAANPKQEKKAKIKESKAKELLEFVRKSKEADSMTLINKFGDDTVDELIASGEIVEEHGRIRLL